MDQGIPVSSAASRHMNNDEYMYSGPEKVERKSSSLCLAIHSFSSIPSTLTEKFGRFGLYVLLIDSLKAVAGLP